MKSRTYRPRIEPLENRTLPSATSSVLLPAIYQDLLHRAPDAGAAGFARQIDSGVSAAVVVHEIQTAPGNEYALNVVAQDYQNLLKRTGAPSELLGWARQMAAGVSDQLIEAMIAGSGEYFALHGSTAAGFMDGLFTDALGRADTEGAFIQRVSQGASRETVAYEVFTSPEGLLHQVLADYDQFLGRSGVDDPGAASFATAMQNGMTHEAVIATMLGSPEYLAFHLQNPMYGGGQVDDTPWPDAAVGADPAIVIIVPSDPVTPDYTPTYDPTYPPDTTDTGCGCTDASYDTGSYDTSGGDYSSNY